MVKQVPRTKILLVSSSGGVLLDLLALRPWWSRHDAVWAAVPAADTESALAGELVHWQEEQRAGRPLELLSATFGAWRLLRREQPTVVVSAGSGVAVGFFLASRLLHVPTIWISTLNLIETPGLAGRLCGRLASIVLLQRDSMHKVHGDGIVLGELY